MRMQCAHDASDEYLLLHDDTAQDFDSRRTSRHNTLHTNARLDLENFEWVYLGDRLTDFDEILTQGSWLQVAANFVPPHEFGLKLCP